MNTQTYYIEKTSDTSADTLLAVGFAELLRQLLHQLGKTSKGLLIQNCGSHYQIHMPALINEDDIQKIERALPLVRPLISEKQIVKQAKLGWDIESFGFPYDTQQQQSKAYYEARKLLSGNQKRPEALFQKKLSAELQKVENLRPRPEYMHYQAISQMKVVDTFNELTRRWYTLTAEQTHYLLHILFMLFGARQNDMPSAIAQWQRFAKEQQIGGNLQVTALQVINPTTGKGANRPRAGELILGNQDSFWPLELLKFSGFMYAAAPFVVQESKDRKTYVLQPNKMELSRLKTLMDDFRKVCWSSTAVKLDIMASLRFTQALIEHRRKFFVSEEKEDDPFDEKELFSTAQGFEVGLYKDLGSAYATMNVASINIPHWLPSIDDIDDAEVVSNFLAEHVRIIQDIQDSRGKEGSEEYELLRFYRDFLSGYDLRPFWKFTAAYASYLMSQREHEKNPKRHIQQLSYEGLETVIMNTQSDNTKLTDITGNPGFQHIAKAIRYSTVIPQREKARGEERVYEIRYGLGQELMRKGRYRNEFMMALNEFLHLYNAENARVEEKAKDGKRPKYFRSNVVYTDIDEVTRLVDEFKSPELICSMLVAYGYAANPRKAEKSDAVSGFTSDDSSGESGTSPSDDEE